MLEIKYFSQLGSAGNVQIISNDSAISLTAFITFNFSLKLGRKKFESRSSPPSPRGKMS